MFDKVFNAITPACRHGAMAAMPSIDWPWWHRYQGTTGEKYASTDPDRLPSNVRRAIDMMATSLEGLLPAGSFWDMDLHGAGVHMMPPGSWLGRHQDAVRHPVRPWIRTTSAVLFLNTLWGNDAGGELYLEGDDEVTVEVIPEAGKAVVFPTEGRWHGVMQTAPHADWRVTLALFGWRVAEPNEALSGSRAATFVSRPERVSRFPPDGPVLEF